MHLGESNRIGLLGMARSVAALAGCASPHDVVAKRAPGFKLAGDRAVGLLQPLASDRGNVRSLIGTHLIDATTRQLEAAGLRYVDTPWSRSLRNLPQTFSHASADICAHFP